MSGSTGCTPGLTHINMGVVPPDVALPPSAGKTARELGDLHMRSPKAPRGDGDTDAATTARSILERRSNPDVSPLSDCVSTSPADAGTPTAAGATMSSNDSSEEDEDAGLMRMVQMRRQSSASPRSQQSALGVGTPLSPSRLSRGASSTSFTASSPPPVASPAPLEEGWEASPRRSSRRQSSTQRTPGTMEGASSSAGGTQPDGKGEPTGTPNAGGTAADGSGCSSGGGAGAASGGGRGGDDCDDDDDSLYGVYAAAKDASRRKNGKHGRNTKQAVERAYAIEARNAQRSGNR